MKKWIIAAGALVVLGLILVAAGGSQTKAKNDLAQAIATTDTTATSPPSTDTTVPETLAAKFDRFFDGDPNLAGFSPATRTCVEKNLAPTMTTYTMDAVLAAPHSDQNYQLVVSGAKLASAGCDLAAEAPPAAAATTTTLEPEKTLLALAGAVPKQATFTATRPWHLAWSFTAGSVRSGGPAAPTCTFRATVHDATGATVGVDVIGYDPSGHGAQAYDATGKLTVNVTEFSCEGDSIGSAGSPGWKVTVTG